MNKYKTVVKAKYHGYFNIVAHHISLSENVTVQSHFSFSRCDGTCKVWPKTKLVR